MNNRPSPLFGFSRKPMPSKCPDCEAQMSNVKYERPITPSNYIERSKRHYRSCRCGCIIEWGWPNHFYRRHVLPLFDIKITLGEA